MALGGFGQKQIEEIERLRRDATELDARRRIQIGNQVDSINRLLRDGSYNAEMAALQDKLVASQDRLRRIVDVIADAQIDDASKNKILEILEEE